MEMTVLVVRLMALVSTVWLVVTVVLAATCLDDSADAGGGDGGVVDQLVGEMPPWRKIHGNPVHSGQSHRALPTRPLS